MIAEALIFDALTPPREPGVKVASHTRKPPLADRKAATNEALRLELARQRMAETSQGMG